MATWTDFQTAIQFVAGLNVALFGVPELRAPGIAAERQQEQDLLRFANTRGEYATSVKYQELFSVQWEPLLGAYRFATFCCFSAAALETALLFHASGTSASLPPNLTYAWLLICLGLLPAVMFLVLYLQSRHSKSGSLRLRNELTDELQRAMSGGAPNMAKTAEHGVDGTQN